MAGIVRVARDKSAVIVKVGDTYTRVSADLKDIDRALELSDLAQEGSWRKPTVSDLEFFQAHTTLASGDVVVEAEPVAERQIRIPKSVQRALSEHAAVLASDPAALDYLNTLATATTTTYSQLEWLKKRVMTAHEQYVGVGGNEAFEWFSKIERSGGLVAAGEPFSPSDDLEYFATSENEDAEGVTGLIAVNRQDDIVLSWTEAGFVPLPESVSDFEAAAIVEVDNDTATAVATWINEGGKDTFSITQFVSGEQNLVDMALEETDEWLNVDEAGTLIAAAADYTPAERSGNAQRQQRQDGGKFGGPQRDDESEPTAVVVTKKATLPVGMELLADVAGRIAEYLAASGPAQAPGPVADETTPVVAALTPDDSTVAPLYLALVDPVDTTAVTDIAAVIPGEDGSATAWVRKEGVWTPDTTLVANLQGATPPPVVELTDEPTIKDILSQVDAFDNNAAPAPDAEEAPATPPPGPVQASALYGDFGEILPAGVVIAAGIPGVSDTPSDKASTERLMRYWAYGAGAAKIRWGTPGDLTRAHRYLSKYVGTKRAWGLAQNLHKRVMGVSNREHDIAAGQTK